jgi:hypothetical protein
MAKKRKLAASTIRPAPLPPIKTAKTVVAPVPLTKGKEPFKPKSALASSSSNSSLAPKAPFRPADAPQGPTITLVKPEAARGALGPPSRPSAQLINHQLPMAVPPTTHLQQSRVVLAQTLEEKAIELRSEDISLPEINSE